ncbi:MAG: fumarylacetoacetate hydrolase family protein [Candidatus Limnocylindrales bacterium]
MPITQAVTDHSQQTASLAIELEAAERDRAPVQPISARVPGFSLEQAYAVQSAVIGRRLAGGAQLVGHKVGLTNVAMQKQLGVDEPDFGRLLDDMEIAADGEISMATLIQPRIEPEIAFILGSSLVGPGVTMADVLAATEAVAPVLEIIDSRIADWRITLVDTVADNASSSRFVLGPRRAVGSLDLAEIEGRLEVDGTSVGSGVGAAVLGHPAAAVAWLANSLAAFGESLAAGEVIIPGALCASVPLVVGSTFRAEIGDLGAVTVKAVA